MIKLETQIDVITNFETSLSPWKVLFELGNNTRNWETLLET